MLKTFFIALVGKVSTYRLFSCELNLVQTQNSQLGIVLRGQDLCSATGTTTAHAAQYNPLLAGYFSKTLADVSQWDVLGAGQWRRLKLIGVAYVDQGVVGLYLLTL